MTTDERYQLQIAAWSARCAARAAWLFALPGYLRPFAEEIWPMEPYPTRPVDPPNPPVAPPPVPVSAPP